MIQATVVRHLIPTCLGLTPLFGAMFDIVLSNCGRDDVDY